MSAQQKKKDKKHVSSGRIYIQATFNNTIITVTDADGDTIAWSSAGTLGFRGAKKSTPYAAQVTAETVVQRAVDQGLQSVHVLVKGPGAGRESAMRMVAELGVEILSMTDITPIPHNGCRPRKVRHP